MAVKKRVAKKVSRKTTTKTAAKSLLKRTPVSDFPGVIDRIKPGILPEYKYVYTTGPFSLPLTTHSIDWGILNNSSTTQKVRITVFKCVTGQVKTAEPPGPLVITLGSKKASHNANAAQGGFFYEIRVECNSKLVFPYASAWPGSIANPIPGSVVKSAEFIRQLP